MDANFIITGAAMGFGREFSRRVLEAGGRVVAADKNVTAGEETIREFKERFGEESCLFCELDVTNRESWRQMWDKAAEFLENKIDVLVNNAGVSPKLGYDICMKINLDGVMNGVQLFEEKLSQTSGGPGGLIINTASCAGLSHTKYHDSLAYWVSKHAVVTITRNLGGPAIVRKTGIKHVALCPWFAETAIVDPHTKDMVMKKSPLKFVTVERVGEAFELAAKEQRSGGLIAVLPNTPLIYYPDTLQETGLAVYLLSKVLQIFGCQTSTPALQGLVLMGMMMIMSYLMHILFAYLGI